MSDALFRLHLAAEFGHETEEIKRQYLDAYHSVAWYVSTGRAYPAWERALARANPKKLLASILNGEDQSVDAQVARATAYLERYCRLAQETGEGTPVKTQSVIVLKVTQVERELLLDALDSLSESRSEENRYAGRDTDLIESNEASIREIDALYEKVSSAVATPAKDNKPKKRARRETAR